MNSRWKPSAVLASVIFVLSLVAVLVPIGAVQAECGSGATRLQGSVKLKSSTPGYIDQLYVGLISVVTLEDDQEYQGWLVAPDGSKLNVGVLTIDKLSETAGQAIVMEIDPAFGNIVYTYTHPSGLNLMSQGYNKFMITIESISDSDPEPSATIAYADAIPLDALEYIRMLLYSAEVAPVLTSGAHKGVSKGIVVGLYEQADLALDHATLAANSTSLDDVKLHTQHVINIIEGTQGDSYDSSSQDPGDGFGLIAYARKAIEYAKAAAIVHPDRLTLSRFEPDVSEPATNAETWATMSLDKAFESLKATDLTAAQAYMEEAKTYLSWAVSGHDIDGDDFIRPVIGEGGALHAEIGAQNMAQFFPSALLPQPEDQHAHHGNRLTVGEEGHEGHEPAVASVEMAAQPELPSVPAEPAAQPDLTDSNGTSGTTIAIVVIAVSALLLLSGGGGFALGRRYKGS